MMKYLFLLMFAFLALNCQESNEKNRITTKEFLEKYVYADNHRSQFIADVLVDAANLSLKECEENEVEENCNEEEKEVKIRDKQLEKIKAFMVNARGTEPPPKCPVGIWEKFSFLQYVNDNEMHQVKNIAIYNEAGKAVAKMNLDGNVRTDDGRFTLLQMEQMGEMESGEILTIEMAFQDNNERGGGKVSLPVKVK